MIVEPIMEPKFTPTGTEESIYSYWEQRDLLKGTTGKPYTILMPPPNANASLHAGHGMYVVDDIMIRYKRLRGFASTWIPGTDHAGFETQFVYEKHLAKQKKSRMDFDRQTLYNDIYTFVKENSGLIFKQFRRLGFLADWNRNVFTLDDHVIERVFETFTKMEREKIVYRDNYMVNYCTYCGTSLADLEVEHIERVDPLYYLKYGPFILATVRPETKFGDTAVAVHPKDKRYMQWIGKEVEVEGVNGKFTLKVIADDYVDPKFGTGVVKITPAHDPNDFEVGKRHGLEIKQVIDLNGRLNELTGPYAGMKVMAARKKIAEDLQAKGLMEKIDNEYSHAVSVCYKCKRDLEPMVIPNWFVKVKDLKQRVIDAVKKNKIKFYPGKYKKQMLQWLDIMHDWPISRQIAWGIRIPVWYKVDKNSKIYVWWLDSDKKFQKGYVSEFIEKGILLSDIEKGLQKVNAPTGDAQPEYVISKDKPDGDYLPETDTFDTWYSSGQWPLVTLEDDEYATRFPTDMMGTMTDILKPWISRMIMFSLYLRNEVPYKDVYLWSMVVDSKGQKMSKSKGNVVNPIDLIEKFGTDAFRASLIFGTSQGGRIPLSEQKVIGMRNFANKIWNIGRFLHMSKQDSLKSKVESSAFVSSKTTSADKPSSSDPTTAKNLVKELKQEFSNVKKQYLKSMEKYKFSQAIECVHEFLWHRFADYYIEQLKESLRDGTIETQETMCVIYFDCLKMLHPFMPFVTEAVWQVFHGSEKSILESEL